MSSKRRKGSDVGRFRGQRCLQRAASSAGAMRFTVVPCRAKVGIGRQDRYSTHGLDSGNMALVCVRMNQVGRPLMPRTLEDAWQLLRESVLGFINDNALSHGAAMAF